jgi:hypothetical protein
MCDLFWSERDEDRLPLIASFLPGHTAFIRAAFEGSDTRFRKSDARKIVGDSRRVLKRDPVSSGHSMEKFGASISAVKLVIMAVGRA